MNFPLQRHVPCLYASCGFMSVSNFAAKSCQSNVLSKASRALCVVICVSVFTVPPSFSMNLTGKHSCVYLDFVRLFVHFFHVLQMMQMVYFLSRLQQWGQDVAPGRMLNFASLHVYALWNGRLAWP